MRLFQIALVAALGLAALAAIVLHLRHPPAFVSLRAIVHEAQLELVPTGKDLELLAGGLQLRELSWQGVQQVGRAPGPPAAGTSAIKVCGSFHFALEADGAMELSLQRVRRDRILFALLGSPELDGQGLVGTLTPGDDVEFASRGIALPSIWPQGDGPCRPVEHGAAPLRLVSTGASPSISLTLELPPPPPEVEVVVLDAGDLDGPDVLRRLRLPLPEGEPLPAREGLVFLDRAVPPSGSHALLKTPMELAGLRLWRATANGVTGSTLVAARVEFPNGEADPLLVPRNGLLTLRPREGTTLILHSLRLGERGLELAVEGEAGDLRAGFGRPRQALPTALQAFYADRARVWLAGTLLSAFVAMLGVVFAPWNEPGRPPAREEAVADPAPGRTEPVPGALPRGGGGQPGALADDETPPSV